MVLLNLRSLSKHLTEIVNDHRLIQNDIVFSFESQINPQEDIESKANHFEQITVFFFFLITMKINFHCLFTTGI